MSIHESQQKQTGIPYRLSNELDENGCPFVLASDGTTIFGEINEETGLIPAPIKLSEGTKDYGLLHIESRHGQQIKQSGFKSIIEFVENVAQNYTDIKEGKVRNRNKTYIIEVSDKYNNTFFVELSQDGSYWNVNSAGVFRKRYSQEKKTVWSASEVQNQQSVADDTLRAQGNPDTNIAPNGTVSQMVHAKDSKESPDIQEADNKNSNLSENEVQNATSPASGDSNLSKNKADSTKKLLNEAEYINLRLNDSFENRKDKTLSRKDWENTDEYIEIYNNVADEYPAYIANLGKSGELQNMFDKGTVSERIKIQNAIETAGYSVPDFIDRENVNKEAREKREARRKEKMRETMNTLGIDPDTGKLKQPADTEERYRESGEPVSPETLEKDRAELEEIFGKSFFPNVFETVKKRTAERMAALTIWKIKSPILTDANHTKTTHISDLNRTFNIKDSK